MNKQTELEQEAGRRALARRTSASPNSAKAQAEDVAEANIEAEDAPKKKRTRKPRTVVADAPVEATEVEAQTESFDDEPEGAGESESSDDELDALLKD